MKGISDRKSFDESFLAAYGKNLNDIEGEWRATLISTEGGGSLLKTEKFKDDSDQKGSCGGGRMGFETMLFIMLIFTIFVRKINLYYLLRNKLSIT